MPRRRYRSRLSVLVEILRVLKQVGPMPATRLCEYVNMPYDRLKLIIVSLEKNMIISARDTGKSRVYYITEKGLKELDKLEKALDILVKLGLS